MSMLALDLTLLTVFFILGVEIGYIIAINRCTKTMLEVADMLKSCRSRQSVDPADWWKHSEE